MRELEKAGTEDRKQTVAARLKEMYAADSAVVDEVLARILAQVRLRAATSDRGRSQ
jgi:hypothetical protein